MAGDPNNAGVWAEADVLTAGLAVANPVGNAAFVVTTGNWSPVGILDGSAGFSESQDFDSTDYFGWGFGKIASSRKNLAITKTFTALEENLVTLGLAYDASGLTVSSGVTSGDLAARDLNLKFKIAFELRGGPGTGASLRRLISKNYAQIDSIGDVTEGEDNLMTRQVTVAIYPDANKKYWVYYKGVTP